MGNIEKMVQHAIYLAENDYYGYSWADRWDHDRDCSSLVYDSAYEGGYPVGRGPDKTRYTGTMIDDFEAAGFTCKRPWEVDPYRGCIFLRDPWGSGGHTEIYIGYGQTVGAPLAETGGVYGEPGDQTGYEISITDDPGGWDYVLCPPIDEPKQMPGEPVNDMGFVYQAHVQNLGWCDPVRDGQTAGTTGYALRLECLMVEPCEGVTVQVKTHIQNKGWLTFPPASKGNPQACGTTGQGLRMECIEVDVLENTTGKQLEYRVHEQDYGWLAWTPAGFPTGSDGQGRRIEAIEMRLV